MIVAINYADSKFKKAQHWNSKTAIKYGAEKVIEYGPDDIDENFRNKNREILQNDKGGGYYLWKPYILNKAIKSMDKDDYLVYTDAGSIFVNPIQNLIACMKRENTDIMVFSLEKEMLERKYTKRDAFILMDCNSNQFANTPQTIGGYVILKKTAFVEQFLKEDLQYAQDIRIISDNENVLQQDNYADFITHRHDQSIWSLMVKKYGLVRFRDPSQYGMCHEYESEVTKRSDYPQIIYSHRKNGGSRAELLIRYNMFSRMITKIGCKIMK